MLTRLKNELKRTVTAYYPLDYRRTLWLIGSARSGTTWIASLINAQNKYRELFEPFHPRISSMRSACFREHLFLYPGDDNQALRLLGQKVLKGRFYDPDMETMNFSKVSSRGLLIVKDVFASLAAKEVCEQGGNIRPVLLMRNPYAVALSLRNTQDWDWPSDPLDFLRQKELFEEYLRPHEGLIRDIAANGSYLDRQFLIWSIINYVPLRQFQESHLLVTFYEDWLSAPNQELRKIHGFLDLPSADFDLTTSDKFLRSSQSSSKSSFDKMSWKGQLTTAEIASGRAILDVFGFDALYDKNSSPNSDILTEIRGS